MFKRYSKILVVAAVAAVACVAITGTASAAWQAYYTKGTIPSGGVGQPQLKCTRSGNRLAISVSNPDVGGREAAVVNNADGSYTILPVEREWVYYRATLYKPAGSDWELVGQGSWWKTFTGPFNPNVGSTTPWWNLTLQKWDYELTWSDGVLPYEYRLSGGNTVFSNLPAGPRYAVVVEYYWGPTSHYGAAWANIWEPNASC